MARKKRKTRTSSSALPHSAGMPVWASCLLCAVAMAVATVFALQLFQGWALVWAWPTWLALVLTAAIPNDMLKWILRGLSFAAFYMLILWPLWRARATVGNGVAWVAAQLVVLTIAFHAWFLPFLAKQAG